MEFRSNILVSVAVHATIFALVLVLAGRDVVFRVPERFIAVTLLEHQADTGLKNFLKSREKGPLPEKRIAKPAGRLRQAMSVETPPATKRAPIPEKHAVPRQENSPPRGLIEMLESGPLEGDAFVYPGLSRGGPSGITPYAVQPAGAGKDVTQAGAGAGNNGNMPGDHSAINAIRAAIEKAKSYPLLARKRGFEGTVTAEFTIGADGYPENIRIIKSSGYEILDEAAKRTLARASPFPVINGNIEVPITFRIRK